MLFIKEGWGVVRGGRNLIVKWINIYLEEIYNFIYCGEVWDVYWKS